MIDRTTVLAGLCILVSLFSCSLKDNEGSVDYRVHTFYYAWYGNPEIDGDYYHWNHQIVPHWADKRWDSAGNFLGGKDIGADFYPELGCYSSNDPKTIEKHMRMIKDAGIGVVVISWWGKNAREERSMLDYFDIADKYDLKIAFHIEPFFKSIKEFHSLLEYLHNNYGKHPALYKYNGKPLHYIYDSYKLRPGEWQKITDPDGELSVRNTALDAYLIGIFTLKTSGEVIRKAGFDGFYTYYASEGYMYGSTPSNWPSINEFAVDNDLIFIPCVGPGYIDTRIRPWNSGNIEDRDEGRYYEWMFSAALDLNPEIIGITSFNEWHEGTQIEPAIPKSLPDYTYEDYGEGVDPKFYILKTRELIDQFK